MILCELWTDGFHERNTGGEADMTKTKLSRQALPLDAVVVWGPDMILISGVAVADAGRWAPRPERY